MNIISKIAYALFRMIVILVAISPLHSQTIVDFQSVNASASPGFVDATQYLSNFAITLSGVTPGTQVVIQNNNFLYGGVAVSPTHPPNLMTQNGAASSVSFTLNFSAQASVGFTRPELIAATPSGVTHPLWSAHAFDGPNGTGNEIATAGEGLIRSFSNVPPAIFTLSGSRIMSVRFDSDAQNFAGFGALLIGELRLVAAPTLSLIQDRLVPMVGSSGFSASFAGPGNFVGHVYIMAGGSQQAVFLIGCDGNSQFSGGGGFKNVLARGPGVPSTIDIEEVTSPTTSVKNWRLTGGPTTAGSRSGSVTVVFVGAVPQ